MLFLFIDILNDGGFLCGKCFEALAVTLHRQIKKLTSEFTVAVFWY